MKILLPFIYFFSLSTLAQEYRCTQHSYQLRHEVGGGEHVVHELFYNLKTEILEISEENWFVENIECTDLGFKVIANHIQYGDKEKRTFEIIGNSENLYEIR